MKAVKNYAIILMAIFWIVTTGVSINADTSQDNQWTNENSIIVSIKEGYIEEVTQSLSGAFPEIDTSAIYITHKSENNLELLMVLNLSKIQTLQDAVETLTKDKKVKYVKANDQIPFESIVLFNKSAATIEVGEKIKLKIEEIKLYRQNFSFDKLCISLDDYDSNKEYTPEDFAQFEIKEVKKSSYMNYLILTLKEPGYFNMIKALNAFAIEPSIKEVYPIGVDYPSVVSDKWTSSNPSSADFTVKEIPYGNKEVEIIGLKEGTATIKYAISVDGGSDSGTCEITVVKSQKKVLPKPEKENPVTGDYSHVTLSTLIISICFGLIILNKKRKVIK